VQRFYDSILPKYRALWDQATADGLRWPGFHPARLELSDALLEAYRQMNDDPI
jgi:hypothetical protein